MNMTKTNYEWEHHITNLKEIAELQGISRAELARSTGYAESTIKRVFDLNFCPKYNIVLAIANALGYTLKITKNEQ